jgi:hypothetical protein
MKTASAKIVVCLLAVLAFAAGTIGFMQVAGREYGLTTAMWLALQLFFLNSSGDVKSGVPWMLELGRWTAVMVSFSALAGVVLNMARGGFMQVSLFLQRSRLGRLRRRPLHVVCGLGRKGLKLAEDLQENNCDVLAIDCSEELVEKARARNIPALLADGTREETYRMLPWHRVERVVLMMGGTDTNLLGTLAIGKVAPPPPGRHGKDKTRIYAHVPTLSQRSLHQQMTDPKGKARGVPVRLFNYYEKLGWEILRRFPVEALSVDLAPGHDMGFTEAELKLLGPQGVEIAEEQVPHVFLRPTRDFTAAFVCLLARVCHYPITPKRRWTRIKVFVVDAEAEAWVASLQEVYPPLRRTGDHALIDLAPLVPSPGESPAEPMARQIQGLPPGTPITVLFDIHNATTALQEAVGLLQEANLKASDAKEPSPQPMPLLRCLFDFAEKEEICRLIDSHPLYKQYLFPLPTLTKCCGSAVLFDDSTDQLARMVHENYLSLDSAKNTDPARDIKSWEQLSLEDQEGNRTAFAYLSIVLRVLKRKRQELLEPGLVWDPPELEALAEAEHRRWSAQRLMDGWRPEHSLGFNKNEDRRRHGCLDRFYDGLPEENKEKDRTRLTGIPDLLKRLRTLSSPGDNP